ncbi:MAG: CYTH domain-containing protein [Flavobacteriaceae bacterium]
MTSDMEIERKFLVISDEYRKAAYAKNLIIQGFLSTDPERTIRIRIKEDKGYLTVKGRTDKSGTSRMEWEYPINLEDAREMLKICNETLVEKTRYLVKSGNHVFEVDEFLGENDGLVIAEVELDAKEEEIIPPLWLGEEVTGDPKYYNSQLSKTPYLKWNT